MLTRLGDLFFPRMCVVCDTQGSLLCEDCLANKLNHYQQQLCHVCKKEVTRGLVHKVCENKTLLDGVVVAVHYNRFSATIVEELKYNLYFAVAGEIGKIIKNTYEKSCLTCEVAIPIPLHKFKENFRGFNQAEL